MDMTIAKSPRFTIDNWMAAWNPINRHIVTAEPGKIVVGPWPDTIGWSDKLRFTTGACYMERHNCDKWLKIAMMFIDFNTMVLRDGIAPQDAHREFLKIDEYRRHIAPD